MSVEMLVLYTAIRKLPVAIYQSDDRTLSDPEGGSRMHCGYILSRQTGMVRPSPRRRTAFAFGGSNRSQNADCTTPPSLLQIPRHLRGACSTTQLSLIRSNSTRDEDRAAKDTTTIRNGGLRRCVLQ